MHCRNNSHAMMFELERERSISFSYAESVEMYLDEEELRYYMPLKEYLAYCEALRLG